MDREYFHRLLVQRGTTRRDFEKLNELSASSLTVALRGKVSPTLKNIKKWSRCLHLTAEEVDKLFQITERYSNESN